MRINIILLWIAHWGWMSLDRIAWRWVLGTGWDCLSWIKLGNRGGGWKGLRGGRRSRHKRRRALATGSKGGRENVLGSGLCLCGVHCAVILAAIFELRLRSTLGHRLGRLVVSPRRWGRRAIRSCFGSVRETKEHVGCVVRPGLRRVLWSSLRPSWNNQTILCSRPYSALFALLRHVLCHALILYCSPQRRQPSPPCIPPCTDNASCQTSVDCPILARQTAQASPLLWAIVHLCLPCCFQAESHSDAPLGRPNPYSQPRAHAALLDASRSLYSL